MPDVNSWRIPEAFPGETSKAIHDGTHEELARRMHVRVFGDVPLDYFDENFEKKSEKIPKVFYGRVFEGIS